ncbi:hypothetical protein REO66_001035 [Salmonella enterica]|nr:hypothetical protein [Salmonella enterica]
MEKTVVNTVIQINTQHLGVPSAGVSALADGLFGGIPAGPMEICRNANTALVGWSVLRTETVNHPNPDAGYGVLRTIDTMGAGATGKRYIPVNTISQEWVFQYAMMTDGGLYTRQKINTTPWSGWVKRW